MVPDESIMSINPGERETCEVYRRQGEILLAIRSVWEKER